MSSETIQFKKPDWLSVLSVVTLVGAALSCLMVMWFVIPLAAFITVAVVFFGAIGAFAAILVTTPPDTRQR